MGAMAAVLALVGRRLLLASVLASAALFVILMDRARTLALVVKQGSLSLVARSPLRESILGTLRAADRVYVEALAVERASYAIRVVGDEGRLSWQLDDRGDAERESERVAQFLQAAGLHITSPQTALRGSIRADQRGSESSYSWLAAGHGFGRHLTPRLGLWMLLIFGFASLFLQGVALEFALIGLVLLALSTLFAPGADRRALLTLEPGGFRFAHPRHALTRKGDLDALLETAPESAVMKTPEALLLLRAESPLSASAAAGHDRVLSREELSPPEMRWLVESVRLNARRA